MLFGTMNVQHNELVIGEVPVSSLVKTYGSPLYVYDKALIKDNMKVFTTHFSSVLFQTKVAYASKAFLTKAMVRLLMEQGLSLDVVSVGELYTAQQVGFPMEQVFVHGNNKSRDELKYYLQAQVGTIIVDNIEELDILIELAQLHNQKIRTLFRVNPGIEAHTHEYIITAKHTSKFGESIYDLKRIQAIMKRYAAQSNVTLSGFHCHIGSQVFDLSSYVKTIEVMSTFINKLEREFKTKFSTLNLGGGFGVYYTEGDTALNIEALSKAMIRTVEEKILVGELSITELVIEPGRSIVANAGTTLYTVGYTKKTYGHQDYVFVDGGMTDNIRPALYQAEYDCVVANKMDQPASHTYTVAGKLCESGDVLIRNIKLPEVAQGDILAILTTGAYTYSMSSNYNRLLKPAVVFVENGQTELVVKRETLDDLVRNDV